MNQIHKTDNYNFTQPSQTGRAGFEAFKNDADGLYYFHFNDAKGQPILFSQAYQREATRDKGILSVIKNAANEALFERKESIGDEGHTENGFYFILRAANRQEIARSRVFKSLAELIQKQTYFCKNLSLNANDTALSPTANAQPEDPEVKPATGASPALLKAENTELKDKIEQLERQLAGLQSVSLEGNMVDETLRHVFRVEIYKNNMPERLHGHIIHPFSEQKQTFTGFDIQTILAFMLDKLKADLPKDFIPSMQKGQATTLPPQYPSSDAAHTSQASKTTPANRLSLSNERSPVSVINMTNQTPNLEHNQPFALILTALPTKRYGVIDGQACLVEVQAFNLDTREKFKLLEKRLNVESVNNTADLSVHIEPMVLNTGNYRLSLIVQVLANDTTSGEIVQKWFGSIILQVF